jgi:death-on-curing protein
MEPVFLAVDEVLEIHRQQIERYGGSFGGEFLHPSIPGMAAAYLFHLCLNHAFIDGNKRVGASAAIAFLLMNDWEPLFDPDEFADLVLSVASGNLGKAALTEKFALRCTAYQTLHPFSRTIGCPTLHPKAL